VSKLERTGIINEAGEGFYNFVILDNFFQQEPGESCRGRTEKTMGHMSLRAGKKFIFSEGGACVLCFTVIKSFE
jgi:hypothetical protein